MSALVGPKIDDIKTVGGLLEYVNQVNGLIDDLSITIRAAIEHLKFNDGSSVPQETELDFFVLEEIRTLAKQVSVGPSDPMAMWQEMKSGMYLEREKKVLQFINQLQNQF